MRFLRELRSCDRELAAQWHLHPDLVEAHAVAAIASGQFAPAIAAFERELESASAPHANASRERTELPRPEPVVLLRWLAELLTWSGSRARAKTILARLEAERPDDPPLGRLALLRGMLAYSERFWVQAEHEFRAAKAIFEGAADTLGALESDLFIALVLGGRGLSAEAVDDALEVMRQVPRGGLLDVRVGHTLAKLYLDLFELESAQAQIDRIRALGESSFEATARLTTHEYEIAWWREDWAHARSRLDELVAASCAADASIWTAFTLYSRALMELDAGAYEASIDFAERAADAAERAAVSTIVDGVRLVQCCAHAALGRRREAVALYRATQPTRATDVNASYQQGLSALAELLLADLETLPVPRDAWRHAASENLARLVHRDAQGRRLLDANFPMRVLGRRLSPHAARHGFGGLLAIAPRPVAVAEDGSSFELESGVQISIANRPLLGRLLAALARQARIAPEEPLSLDALLHAGWPADRAQKDSLLARLKVALSTLRQLGLGDSLESARAQRKEGYLLRLASRTR